MKQSQLKTDASLWPTQANKAIIKIGFFYLLQFLYCLSSGGHVAI